MQPRRVLSRRAFLHAAGLSWLARGVGLPFLQPAVGRALQQVGAPPRSGRMEPLGVLPFVDEGDAWVRLFGSDDRRFGFGLGGRKIFDLETLTSDRLVVPSEEFFLRTFRPDDLGDASGWTVRFEGRVGRTMEIPVEELQRRARPCGTTLLECSGNSGEHRFGLISAARWQGVPAASVLARARPLADAAAVEVIGDDLHDMPSLTSKPGASWIFARGQLEESGAFFATGMNGLRLSRDHGYPLRLVVPGWYGCVCIKWVRAVRFLSGDVVSSGQMREFAARTHQSGVPERALDFQPATIDPAAMPVRVEAWRGPGRVTLRITGVVWGEMAPSRPRVQHWSIRCGAAAWRPIDRFATAPSRRSWRLWSHLLPDAPAGPMEIRLRVDDPGVRTRRLDRGHYARTVEVPA